MGARWANGVYISNTLETEGSGLKIIKGIFCLCVGPSAASKLFGEQEDAQNKKNRTPFGDERPALETGVSQQKKSARAQDGPTVEFYQYKGQWIFCAKK